MPERVSEVLKQEPRLLQHRNKTFHCNCSTFAQVVKARRESRKRVDTRGKPRQKQPKLFIRSFGVQIIEEDPETNAVTDWKRCRGFSLWR